MQNFKIDEPSVINRNPVKMTPGDIKAIKATASMIIKEELKKVTHTSFFLAKDLKSLVNDLQNKISHLELFYSDVSKKIEKDDKHWGNELIKLIKEVDEALNKVNQASQPVNFDYCHKIYNKITEAERELEKIHKNK